MLPQRHISILRKVLLPLLILCSWGRTALAETSRIPAAFVDIGFGARPMGMGGAFVAISDDANAVLWNPAGLIRLDRTQLTGMYANQLGLVPYGFVALGQPISEQMSLGAAAIYSGDGALQEMTTLVSLARRAMPGLDVGLSAKARMATYGNNPDGLWDPGGGNLQVHGQAVGFGLDLGLLYAVGRSTTIGLMWRDIWAPLSWQAQNAVGTARGGGESIPMALILGTAHRLGDEGTLSLNLDRSLSSDASDRISLGYENRLWGMCSLRTGYCQQINADPDRIYALGLGLAGDLGTSWQVAFDLAYLFHDLADTPRVSLTLGF